MVKRSGLGWVQVPYFIFISGTGQAMTMSAVGCSTGVPNLPPPRPCRSRFGELHWVCSILSQAVNSATTLAAWVLLMAQHTMYQPTNRTCTRRYSVCWLGLYRFCFTGHSQQNLRIYAMARQSCCDLPVACHYGAGAWQTCLNVATLT
jgi:hypothetical protein